MDGSGGCRKMWMYWMSLNRMLKNGKFNALYILPKKKTPQRSDHVTENTVKKLPTLLRMKYGPLAESASPCAIGPLPSPPTSSGIILPLHLGAPAHCLFLVSEESCLQSSLCLGCSLPRHSDLINMVMCCCTQLWSRNCSSRNFLSLKSLICQAFVWRTLLCLSSTEE